MTKKAAISLSVEFLVVIIIAMVTLGLSTMLFSDVFRKVQTTDIELKQQYKEEIWHLLDTGSIVVAPLNTQTVSRGDLAVFGVGVKNILDTQNFTINVTPQNVGGCLGSEDWLGIPRKTREIEINSQDIFTIGINVPQNVKSCTYVFDVKITDESGNVYGTLQKLYVVAK